MNHKKNINKIIEKKLKDIVDTINKFLEENPESLYSQDKSNVFTKEMNDKLKELISNFEEITEDSIKEISKKNIFIKKNSNSKEKISSEESKDKKSEIIPEFISQNPKNKIFINQELEKIELLNIKLSTAPQPIAQLILYQLRNIEDLLNKSFNNKIRTNEFTKHLKPIFTSLEYIITT